jgi:hypothetical protein
MNWLKSPDLRAVALLFILWLVFFWRLLTPVAGDQASFKQGDFSAQFVAFGAYQYERFANGEVPLWNPYNNGGLPFIADTQAAVFYPPRLLTIFLSIQAGGWSYHALELEAIFHVLAYSLLMYLFVRRLTASTWGAFVAAIVAAYGGFISGYPPLQLALLEAVIWLPLSALGVLEATRHERIKWSWLFLAGFALGLSWMAGHPQSSWFISYFVIAWLGYRVYSQKQGWRAFIGGAMLLGIITLGVTAVTFLPGVEYLLLASRSNLAFEAKSNGFPFQDIAQLLFPGSVSLFSPLYIGIPALVLVYIAARYRWRQSIFWMILALVALLHSFGGNSAFYYLLYNPMPGLRFFRGQERAALLVANSFAVLAGIGMTQLVGWSKEQESKSIERLLLALLLFVAAIATIIFVAWWGNIGNFGQAVSIAAFSALIAALTWGLFSWQLRYPNRNALILITVLIVFELFSVNIDASSNYDAIPADAQISINPLVQFILENAPDEEPFRVDGYRGLTGNYGSMYGVMDMRGISPLFLQSAYNIIYRDYVNNPRAWEVFAVHYILSERDFFAQVETEVLTEANDAIGHIYLHEIQNPRPFAQLVYAYDIVGSDQHAIELLNDPNYQPRHRVILQESPSLTLPETAPSDATATVTRFEPETFAIEIDTQENAILSLAHVDYPAWEARLDDEPVSILRAYGALTAVEIPAGQHTLVFTYAPKSYYLGAIMSLITWIGLALVLISILLKRKPGSSSVVEEGMESER